MGLSEWSCRGGAGEADPSSGAVGAVLPQQAAEATRTVMSEQCCQSLAVCLECSQLAARHSFFCHQAKEKICRLPPWKNRSRRQKQHTMMIYLLDRIINRFKRQRVKTEQFSTHPSVCYMQVVQTPVSTITAPHITKLRLPLQHLNRCDRCYLPTHPVVQLPVSAVVHDGHPQLTVQVSKQRLQLECSDTVSAIYVNMTGSRDVAMSALPTGIMGHRGQVAESNTY